MKNITKFLALFIAVSLMHTAYAQKSGLSYDLFGIYGTRDKDGDHDDAQGIGVGANYFFTENLGVGLDSYTDGIRLPYLLNASFIYRFVNERMLNPYAFVGFGRQWEHAAQWTGHIGGGAEYKWKSGMGVFLDGRLVVPQDTGNYGLFRLGVRWGF